MSGGKSRSWPVGVAMSSSDGPSPVASIGDDASDMMSADEDDMASEIENRKSRVQE